MPDWTASQVRERFPEFTPSGFPDAVVDQAIATAYRISDADHESTLWCAAHLLATLESQAARMDGGAGEITSESTGPRMTSYRTQADTGREVFFSTSPYGRTFLTLEGRSARRAAGFFYA